MHLWFLQVDKKFSQALANSGTSFPCCWLSRINFFICNTFSCSFQWWLLWHKASKFSSVNWSIFDVSLSKMRRFRHRLISAVKSTDPKLIRSKLNSIIFRTKTNKKLDFIIFRHTIMLFQIRNKRRIGIILLIF